MSGIWYGYLAIVFLVVVALVLGYQDRKARRRDHHAR